MIINPILKFRELITDKIRFIKSFIYLTISLGYIVSFIQPIKGQGLIIFEEQNTIKKDYRYEEMEPPKSMPNYLIQKMAHIQAPTRDYFFGFTIFEKRQIIKLSNENYQIKIIADSIKFYNNLDYKGYKLDIIVFPNTLKISYILKDLNGKTETKIIHTQDFSVHSQILFDSVFFDETKTAYYKIDNIEYQFLYDDNLKEVIDNTLSSIIKLEELKPSIIDTRTRLSKLNGVKAGVVRIYNIDLKKIESDLNTLNPRNSIPNIDLEKFDSEGLVVLFDSLDLATRIMRKKFDNMILRPEYEYYSDGYNAYMSNNLSLAASNFHKAIRQKDSYAPPLYFLAEMAYKQELWDSSAQIIIHILNDLDADIATKKMTLDLSSNLYDKLVDNAEINIKNKNINESVKLLELAIHLCNLAREFDCNENADILMKTARQELFNSWVEITKKSINSNKTELSINYLNWTQSYLNTNKEDIKDSIMMDSLRFQMINLLITSALQNNSLGKSTQAIHYANLADSLSLNSDNSITQNIRNTALNNINNRNNSQIETYSKKKNNLSIDNSEISNNKVPEINLQDRYNNFISIGKNELKENRYLNALNYFSAAKELETNTTIIVSDSLKSYLKKSGKPVILSDLKSGDLQAWGFHFDVVKSIIKIAKEQMQLLYLEDDVELQTAIHRLEKLAFENQCHEASTNFTHALQTASKSFSLNNFISANNFWMKALIISRENSNCNIDSLIPKELMQKYKSAIDFQTKKNELDMAMQQGNDSLAFSLALELKRIYKTDSISQYRLLNYDNYSLAQSSPKSIEIQYLQLKFIIENEDFINLKSGINNLLRIDSKNPKYHQILKEAVALFARHECSTKPHIKPNKLAVYHFPDNRKSRRVFIKNYKCE